MSQPMQGERRCLTARAPQWRAATGDGLGVASGYAAVWNSTARIAGLFDEAVRPGAFTDTIRDDEQLALWSHDFSEPLARRSSGTLRLREDDIGLHVEIDIPDTSRGRDLAVLLRNGTVNGMSYWFYEEADEWDYSGDVPMRWMNRMRIWEVTATAIPAYEATSLGMMREHQHVSDSARQRARALPAGRPGGTPQRDRLGALLDIERHRLR